MRRGVGVGHGCSRRGREAVFEACKRELVALQIFARAVGIGALSGLRTFTPSAVLHLTRGTGGVRRTLAAAAIGELIADKLPFVPDRTSPGPLLGRACAGAYAASEVVVRHGGIRTFAAIGGALGAIGATFGAYHARRVLVARGVPPLLAALVEDAIAVGGAVALRPRGMR